MACADLNLGNEKESSNMESDTSDKEISPGSLKRESEVKQSLNSDDEEYQPTRSRRPCRKSKIGAYTCKKCDSKFRKKEILKNHMMVHSDYKPHKCNICMADFKRKGDYNRHMSMHARTNNKCHRCVSCKLTFLRKKEYSKHLLTHSHLFPFKCKDCGESKMFSTKKALNKHMGSSSAQDYKCSICAKIFSCRVSHGRHLQMHRIQCQQCDQNFDSSELLENHISVLHPRVHPFICGMCNSGFQTKFQLVQHKKNHSVINLFNCQSCLQEFTVKDEVKNHSCIKKNNSLSNGSLTR